MTEMMTAPPAAAARRGEPVGFTDCRGEWHLLTRDAATGPAADPGPEPGEASAEVPC